MEDIKSVIASIVKGCSQAGLDVPDVLAAFVARTVSGSPMIIIVSGCLIIIVDDVRFNAGGG